MAISLDLRVLAKQLESKSEDILIKAATKDKAAFSKVAQAVAAASTLLEEVADDMDTKPVDITETQLDEMAAVARAFDESGDELLMKQASVLDELLLSIAANKQAAESAHKVREDEINRLRDAKRKEQAKDVYTKPREILNEYNKAEATAKAVEEQVKRYMPLEAPLQTRYAPDMPGNMMTRITDHIYQDVDTGKVYDFKQGYKSTKGNEIPGSSVEEQSRMVYDQTTSGDTIFETRESIIGRYAGENLDIVKSALSTDIGSLVAQAEEVESLESLKSVIKTAALADETLATLDAWQKKKNIDPVVFEKFKQHLIEKSGPTPVVLKEPSIELSYKAWSKTQAAPPAPPAPPASTESEDSIDDIEDEDDYGDEAEGLDEEETLENEDEEEGEEEDNTFEVSPAYDAAEAEILDMIAQEDLGSLPQKMKDRLIYVFLKMKLTDPKDLSDIDRNVELFDVPRGYDLKKLLNDCKNDNEIRQACDQFPNVAQIFKYLTAMAHSAIDKRYDYVGDLIRLRENSTDPDPVFASYLDKLLRTYGGSKDEDAPNVANLHAALKQVSVDDKHMVFNIMSLNDLRSLPNLEKIRTKLEMGKNSLKKIMARKTNADVATLDYKGNKISIKDITDHIIKKTEEALSLIYVILSKETPEEKVKRTSVGFALAPTKALTGVISIDAVDCKAEAETLKNDPKLLTKWYGFAKFLTDNCYVRRGKGKYRQFRSVPQGSTFIPVVNETGPEIPFKQWAIECNKFMKQVDLPPMFCNIDKGWARGVLGQTAFENLESAEATIAEGTINQVMDEARAVPLTATKKTPPVIGLTFDGKRIQDIATDDFRFKRYLEDLTSEQPEATRSDAVLKFFKDPYNVAYMDALERCRLIANQLTGTGFSKKTADKLRLEKLDNETDEQFAIRSRHVKAIGKKLEESIANKKALRQQGEVDENAGRTIDRKEDEYAMFINELMVMEGFAPPYTKVFDTKVQKTSDQTAEELQAKRAARTEHRNQIRSNLVDRYRAAGAGPKQAEALADKVLAPTFPMGKVENILKGQFGRLILTKSIPKELYSEYEPDDDEDEYADEDEIGDLDEELDESEIGAAANEAVESVEMENQEYSTPKTLAQYLHNYGIRKLSVEREVGANLPDSVKKIMQQLGFGNKGFNSLSQNERAKLFNEISKEDQDKIRSLLVTSMRQKNVPPTAASPTSRESILEYLGFKGKSGTIPGQLVLPKKSVPPALLTNSGIFTFLDRFYNDWKNASNKKSIEDAYGSVGVKSISAADLFRMYNEKLEHKKQVEIFGDLKNINGIQYPSMMDPVPPEILEYNNMKTVVGTTIRWWQFVTTNK